MTARQAVRPTLSEGTTTGPGNRQRRRATRAKAGAKAGARVPAKARATVRASAPAKAAQPTKAAQAKRGVNPTTSAATRVSGEMSRRKTTGTSSRYAI